MSQSTFLLDVSGDAAGPRTVEAQPGMTMGRVAGNSLRLDEPTVSSQHGRLELRDGALLYVDTSRNGTRVDGSHVLTRDQSVPLRDGLRLELGHARIDVRQKVAAAAPAPARSAPASPAANPIPAQPAREVDLGHVPDGNRTLVPSAQGASSQAALEHLGARLILAGEAERRVVAIRRTPFAIGRGEGSDCRLEHGAVSKEHAVITFDGNLNVLRIEDRGSSNGTRVGPATLAPGIKLDLEPGSYLRFGTIDALFVQTHDRDLVEIPAALDDRVLRLLTSRRKVRAAEAQRARDLAAERGLPLVEVALTEGIARARDWAEAAVAVRAKGEGLLDGLRGAIEKVKRKRPKGPALLLLLSYLGASL
ncbi:MAG: FHA domain-containing protein [Planctomycetaceae bacterium]|nr:FHA domain-containing protein [Planctomycetaceae bacterium]